MTTATTKVKKNDPLKRKVSLKIIIAFPFFSASAQSVALRLNKKGFDIAEFLFDCASHTVHDSEKTEGKLVPVDAKTCIIQLNR